MDVRTGKNGIRLGEFKKLSDEHFQALTEVERGAQHPSDFMMLMQNYRCSFANSVLQVNTWTSTGG